MNQIANFSGYQITEQLYTGTHTLVYRGIRTSDQHPIVIKILRNEYPNFNELVQFRNQYTIAKNLDFPHLVKPLTLETYHNSYALIMEDFGGVSLSDYLKIATEESQIYKSLPLAEFLNIAIQLTDTLNYLYQNRVIHKDIKPANILINPDTKQIQVIDFSISSLLPRETQEIQNANALEGTLAYLSPEQTGRMNRGIDYRSDFYSLGVTFYELLTGELPFVSEDAMELVHCHLAKHPIPIHQIHPEIPLALSEIVSKLMAKNAENRYQTALGIKHDLEICLKQLQNTDKLESFKLGERDISDRFTIPEKLYGREKEVNQLLAAFERVSTGNTEMMLVAGFSGIGKTAAVNEVHKPIVRQRGYFIKGKYDQFNRNIPFSAFVQTFRDLMGQLLSESDEQLQAWKDQIIAAVGDNGQVLIDVIPELENIIGKQPTATELSGTAAQNRFNLLFQKFVKIFTSKEHPLVMFLDDWQWADSASLNLLKLLLQDTGYLLVLGAYRDNEVSPVHPFILTVDEIVKTGVTVNIITLPALRELDMNRLVADTLNCELSLAKPLTKLVYQKTQGNPFFATQFLKALHDDKLISFDWGIRHWQCDIAQVRTLAITDDVVEFMALQLQKLPTQTQDMLKLAACIGAEFDLNTLVIVSEQLAGATATVLWKALQEGLVIPTTRIYKFFTQSDSEEVWQASANPTYRFLHDRVQQAAYSLIPEAQKQVTHWKIGQLLLQGLSQQEQVEQIFDIVNQLNLGRAAISNQTQKRHLAELNLQSGQKAKLSAAYQSAQNYYAIGIDLLPTEAWQTDYELMYALHRNASETAYLCGNFERAEALYATVLVQAQTPLDKAVIYRVQMTQYQLQGRNAEAIAIQRQSLQLLGWTVPVEQESIQASLDEEIATVNQFLAQQTIESILELAKMADENMAKILRILQILFYAAWLDGQTTLGLLALAKMTTLSLQYGNSEMSPFGYVGYGLIANAILKNAAMAYQFGVIAVQLCEQFDNADVRGMTNFLFAADVHSWSRPLREANTYYENAFKYGMEAGNWLTVGFMMMQSGSDRLTYGKNLHDLYAIAQTHADFLRRIKSLENLDALIVGVLQPIRHLLDLTKTRFSFDDDNFSESEYLQKYSNAPYHLAWFYSVKIRHAYLFDQAATYPDLIPKLSLIENTISSHAKVPSSVFYVALMHLDLVEITRNESERQSHWQAILPLEERLNRWQQACPENIGHKCLLIQAEKARINGQKAEAIDFYEQAIAGAQRQDYGYEEALANELAAKFYLGWGKEKVAAGYMQEAYYCYVRWGAKAKVIDLEQSHPQLLAPILQQPRAADSFKETILQGTIASTKTSSSSFEMLDLTTLVKASQAISGEIELNKLLTTLLKIVIANAGASKCVLLLKQDISLKVVALVAEGESPQLLPSIPLELSADVAISLVNTVKRTLEPLVLADARRNSQFAADSYIQRHQPKSVLCSPIMNQGRLIGVLYLENNLTVGAFTSDRVELLNLLCAQAAISLENAQLYEREQQKSQALEKALNDLQNTQLQLVQGEKMSALGNLVAGVAHEINNPVGCILGNVGATEDYVNDLLGLLELYGKAFPEPGDEIESGLETIDLDYLRQDLPQLIRAMRDSGDRIKSISKSLSTFSRKDTDYKQPFNLHDGIESTLLILRHRLKANEHRPEIEVAKAYDWLNPVNCFPGQLNQVFMNIIANAIDVFDDFAQQSSFAEKKAPKQQITIQIQQVENWVKIKIADNGAGIPQEIQARIFDHLFTTKAVGKGTGLGLAIARQIVVETHGGKLQVNSQIGQGTEFVISLPQS